jgi:GxxExxY protein
MGAISGTERENLNCVINQVWSAAWHVAEDAGSEFTHDAFRLALIDELDTRQIASKSCSEVRNGLFRISVVVENAIAVELNAVTEYSNRHLMDCLQHLAVSRLRAGVLLNFQEARVDCKTVLYPL